MNDKIVTSWANTFNRTSEVKVREVSKGCNKADINQQYPIDYVIMSR